MHPIPHNGSRLLVADVRASTPAAPNTGVLSEKSTQERHDTPWRVILYNDHIHTFEEVILQLVKAVSCSIQQAERMAWQAHAHGKTAVFEGSFEACFRVQGILHEIQLITEIEG